MLEASREHFILQPDKVTDFKEKSVKYLESN
jgi:hypothetical protein